jgi:hypothetical protein
LTTATISIKEALAYMESGKIFSCKVVSYNRKSDKGGEIKHYPEALLLRQVEETQTNDRPMTTIERLQAKIEMPKLHKNPNHHIHFTRNIRDVQDGHPTGIIYKIHPPLLLEFNGLTVTP